MKCLPNSDRIVEITVTSLPRHQIMTKNAVVYECVNFSEESLPLSFTLIWKQQFPLTLSQNATKEGDVTFQRAVRSVVTTMTALILTKL